jgi:hypothetical protein
MLTSDEMQQARDILEKVSLRTDAIGQKMVTQILKMMGPPPTITEICDMVPGACDPERAKFLGRSRQAFWEIRHGKARPSNETVILLSTATGIHPERIRAAFP